MNKEDQRVAIQATITHLSKLLQTTGSVLCLTNRQAGLAVEGCRVGIIKKQDEIVDQILESLGHEHDQLVEAREG